MLTSTSHAFFYQAELSLVLIPDLSFSKLGNPQSQEDAAFHLTIRLLRPLTVTSQHLTRR